VSDALVLGPARPAPGSGDRGVGSLAIAALIVGLSVLAGLAAGDPGPQWWIPLAVLAAGAALYAGARWPFESLLLMLGSSVLLVVVRASGTRAVNLIDVLLPPVFLASTFGRARLDARMHLEAGPAHERLHAAERRFTRAVIVFYAAAACSLLQLARQAGAAAALDSGLLMIRAVQGLMLYPLCTLWLRTRPRVEMAWTALFVAGAALALVNVIGVAAWHIPRAGMTFYVNDPGGPIACPNEAGTATLFVGVGLLVRQAMRPHWKNLAIGALMLVLLALTQSRSGLLAWATFALLTLRWVRPARLLTGALGIAALLPLIPQAFWARMLKSAVVERGSFEAYSFFVRVYGWRTAWRVVQEHPWAGIGYLGFRFVSHSYNELRLVLITVENYFYETLVGMGVVGLALLALVIVRLFQLGREVGRAAPAGTLAHHMARFHAPLVLGLLVANMTGDNFVGMVGVAQMAIWTAVLVRSGHAAVGHPAKLGPADRV
jgi:O-antigen ligase